MRIAITGGTGTLGRPVGAELAARGHEVRALSRGSAEFPVDLTTGDGLDTALEGVDVVIDAANGPPSGKASTVLVKGSRRLLDAGGRAGVAHHLTASIVGIDAVPLAYYRVKVAQEAVVREAALPWTIVRSTQFHDLVGGLFAAAGRFGVRPTSSARLQPVAVEEAARAFADAAEAPPRCGVVQVAGPQALPLSELARQWRTGRGGRAFSLPLPLPPGIGRALRAGALTCEDPDVRGTTTFATWLRTPRRSGG